MSKPRRPLVAFAVAAAVLVAVPLAVTATDSFADVSDSNPHHDDITWLAETGVTKGCNPPSNTEFCPGAPVLRQQMASFLRRLAENRVVDAATAQTADNAETLDGLDSSQYRTIVKSAFCGPTPDLTAITCGPNGDGTFPADRTVELLSVDVTAPAAGTLTIAARGGINLANAEHLFWVSLDEECVPIGAGPAPIFQQAVNFVVFNTDQLMEAAAVSTVTEIPGGNHTVRLCAARSGAMGEMLAAELSATWTPGGSVSIQGATQGDGTPLDLPRVTG